MLAPFDDIKAREPNQAEHKYKILEFELPNRVQSQQKNWRKSNYARQIIHLSPRRLLDGHKIRQKHPYTQEKEVSKLQADYIKKRYGKDVKLPNE